MSAPDSETTDHIVELDDLLVRPGTYFNPQTEVVVIVDDSASLDQEVFNMEAYEGADWVHISDEVPVDSNQLELALEEFQTRYGGSRSGVSELDDEYDERGDDYDGEDDGDAEDAEDADEDGQEPGRED